MDLLFDGRLSTRSEPGKHRSIAQGRAVGALQNRGEIGRICLLVSMSYFATTSPFRFKTSKTESDVEIAFEAVNDAVQARRTEEIVPIYDENRVVSVEAMYEDGRVIAAVMDTVRGLLAAGESVRVYVQPEEALDEEGDFFYVVDRHEVRQFFVDGLLAVSDQLT